MADGDKMSMEVEYSKARTGKNEKHFLALKAVLGGLNAHRTVSVCLWGWGMGGWF